MSHQKEAATTCGQKISFLSFQMAVLDGTKSTPMAKEATWMNLAVLGSVGRVESWG
jgi:hypothetical protein